MASTGLSQFSLKAGKTSTNLTLCSLLSGLECSKKLENEL